MFYELAGYYCCLMATLLIFGPIFGLLFNYFWKMQQEERATQLFKRVKDIYEKAKDEEIDKATANECAALADDCLSIINKRRDEAWAKHFRNMLSMRNKVQQMSLFVAARSIKDDVPITAEIEKLDVLRSNGMISEHEFDAFSERFKVSTGDKARGIIRAISDLHAQYKKGVMTEGNYHAALWSLMDKLDREV